MDNGRGGSPEVGVAQCGGAATNPAKRLELGYDAWG